MEIGQPINSNKGSEAEDGVGRESVKSCPRAGCGKSACPEEPAIMVREPDATMQPAPQDNQLMSKYRVLSFKPQLRLQWRGQDGQNETEQPDHSASLGDSITSSTRIRFSVYTGAATVVDGNGGSEGARNESLIQSVVRAHVWVRCLQNGTYECIEALAEANRLHPKVVRQALRWRSFRPTLHPQF